MAELPAPRDLICTLHKCRQMRDLTHAKQLLAYMRQHRLDTHGVLGNHLVPALVDCGSLLDAQQVFDRLPHRSERSWSSLISAYVDQSNSENAFRLFHEMEREFVSPTNFTYLALLKACSRLKDAERGKQMHTAVIQKGFGGDIFIGNTLVDMYGKCGLHAEALGVFVELPVKNTVSWNALMTGYAEHGCDSDVLACFEQMRLDNVLPDDVTLVCCLKACCTAGRGHHLRSEIAEKELKAGPFVGNALVNAYVKCGWLSEARQIFDKLPVQDTVSWTALIGGYTEHGLSDEALSCYKEMQHAGASPDDVTFVCSLKACGIGGDIELGQQLYSDLTKRGFEKELNMGNALVDMYAKCGSFTEAQDLFDQLQVRNVVSWTALIAGYTMYGFCKEALSCFEQMQVEGIPPDANAFACSLKACGHTGASERGWQLCGSIVTRALERDAVISNILVDMFSKFGALAEAQEVFDQLLVLSVVTWTALVGGYSECGFGGKALHCFKQMQMEGVSPVAITFASVLKACGMIGVSETGQEIHTEVVSLGFERELCVGNSIVDMYGKCCSLPEAQYVFDKLPVHDAVSWATIISRYAEQEHEEEVLMCFIRMKLEAVSVDAITYVHCLKACGFLGTLETGREIHAEVKRSGLERDLFVGNTLIDMFGTCGSLSEARQVFNELPLRDVVSWNVMIKGYGENHESHMAFQCFEEMQNQGVRPDAVTFTCLLVACSHASLVRKGQEYFKMMKEVHGITPTLEHWICMVDLLARSGHVIEANRFAEAMQCVPTIEILKILLNGCKIYGKMDLGLQFFEQLVLLHQEDGAAYLLLTDIYRSAGRWSDANRVEDLRNHACANKKPATASIEVNKKLHSFIVGVKEQRDVSRVFGTLSLHLKDEGLIPAIDLVLGSFLDEEGEEASKKFVDQCLSHHNSSFENMR